MSQLNPITNATSFETAIEIIPGSLCRQAIKKMQIEFKKLFPDFSKVCIVPILRGGKEIGEALVKTAPKAVVSPMRMSYYTDDLVRLDEPVCRRKPDIKKIVVRGSTRKVVFTEAVVESQETLKASVKVINKQVDELGKQDGQKCCHPEYHTFALVSKTGDDKVTIPNFRAMFKVHPSIWIHGWGCDNAERGREEKRIMGVLSPHARQIPQPPYFEPLFA